VRHYFLNEWPERGKTCAKNAAIELDHGPIRSGRIVPEGIGGVHALVEGGETDERYRTCASAG
jgi:hypothetical protein